MCQNDGRIALCDTETDEQQKQRNTRNDVGIEHRDIVQKRNRLPFPTAHVEYADCRYAAECGRNGCRKQRYREGVLDGGDERMAYTSRKERGVEIGRKARPITEYLRLRKREDGDNQNWRVQHQQQQPEVRLCKNLFYHILLRCRMRLRCCPRTGSLHRL